MSEYAKLNQEIKEIEEIVKNIADLSQKKETTKTSINKEIENNNDIITQINVINYLYNALT